MEQPMIEFRKIIEVDIEKYSNTGEENIVKLLKEYLVLINNVYEPQEQMNMVSCFMKGFRYHKSQYNENEKISWKELSTFTGQAFSKDFNNAIYVTNNIEESKKIYNNFNEGLSELTFVYSEDLDKDRL